MKKQYIHYIDVGDYKSKHWIKRLFNPFLDLNEAYDHFYIVREMLESGKKLEDIKKYCKENGLKYSCKVVKNKKQFEEEKWKAVKKSLEVSKKLINSL